MPVFVSCWTDSVSNAKGYFVIDTLRSDLCTGGIRMRAGATADEAQRLARTMTYKLAAAGIPFGGAKAAIDYDPSLPDSYEVLKRFLLVHRPFVREFWITNEDLGTKESDIVSILNEFDISSPFSAGLARTIDPEKTLASLARAVELEVDGLRMSDVVTGFGVAQAALEAMEFIGRESRGSRVAIQGFGSVGGSTARYLAREGCTVVLVADVEGAIYCSDGVDVEDLLTRRNRWGVISRSELPSSYQQLRREEWLSVDADMLIPAAAADAIHGANCQAIKAYLIVEGANIPTTPEAEKLLFERGTLVIPDFVANAGAISYTPSVLLGRIKPDADEVFPHLKSQIRGATRRALELSRQEGITPRAAAIRLVEGLL